MPMSTMTITYRKEMHIGLITHIKTYDIIILIDFVCIRNISFLSSDRITKDILEVFIQIRN